jgi:hypothetical protein
MFNVFGERQEVGSPADLVNKNDFVSCGPFVYLLLSGMKHAKLQEVKVGASIHLPLDCFETVDMSLDRSITPGILEGSCYSRILLTQAYSKAAQFWDAISFRLR